jgi:hypothetical protein
MRWSDYRWKVPTQNKFTTEIAEDTEKIFMYFSVISVFSVV